jgi:hypothetical protein
MTRSQTDIQIQKLQTELERLREEENVLQEVISLVKSQLSAVQVRGHVHLCVRVADPDPHSFWKLNPESH